MAFIRADSQSVPVTFSVGEDGHAMIPSITLNLRFGFREDALYVEEEVFDDAMGIFSHAIGQFSINIDVGTFWLLKPGKYRLYGLSDSVPIALTKLLTPQQSSTISKEPLVPTKINVESGLQTILTSMMIQTLKDINISILIPFENDSSSLLPTLTLTLSQSLFP